MKLQFVFYPLPLSFSSCFFFPMFSGDAKPFVQNYRLLPGVSLRFRARVGVGRILPTPAATPIQAKTVDSGRFQLRSRLRLRSPDGSRVRWQTRVLLKKRQGHLFFREGAEVNDENGHSRHSGIAKFPGVEPSTFDTFISKCRLSW